MNLTCVEVIFLIPNKLTPCQIHDIVLLSFEVQKKCLGIDFALLIGQI